MHAHHEPLIERLTLSHFYIRCNPFALKLLKYISAPDLHRTFRVHAYTNWVLLNVAIPSVGPTFPVPLTMMLWKRGNSAAYFCTQPR